MKAAVIAFVFGLFGLALVGCQEVENLYSMGCAETGGTWSSSDGCQKG